ncbi:MAG: CvpA family protein [Candidatus Onthomonas sp.]
MNLFDLIVLGVLALFAFLGSRKGLIMTLASLVVTVLALVGAPVIADQLSPSVAYMMEPAIQNAVQTNVDQAVANNTASDTFYLEEGSFLEQLVSSEFYQHFAESAQQSVEQGIEQATQSVVAAVTQSLAQSLAWLAVYVIAFALILFLGRLLAHVLDLAAMLPGLHFLNKSLGGVCGLLKGLVIVAVVVSLGVGFGLIPQESVDGSALLKLFSSFGTVSL